MFCSLFLLLLLLLWFSYYYSYDFQIFLAAVKSEWGEYFCLLLMWITYFFYKLPREILLLPYFIDSLSVQACDYLLAKLLDYIIKVSGEPRI